MPSFTRAFLRVAQLSSLALTAMSVGGLTAHAQERATLQEVLPLAEKLFANKTLVGDDHVRQVFGAFVHAGSMHWVVGDITLANNSTLKVVDTFVQDEDGKVVLIENVMGQPDTQNYHVYLTPSGGLKVLPRPQDAEATTFVSRECWLEAASTICHKTVRRENGQPLVSIYTQPRP